MKARSTNNINLVVNTYFSDPHVEITLLLLYLKLAIQYVDQTSTVCKKLS